MQNQTVTSFMFPPGVRFHPSDEELIIYYLLNKVNSIPQPAAVIGDIELYNYNPWDLPNRALFGESEWYFFTPRDRKYPNGARPNRSAGSGYWKATGTDKPIMSSSGSRIGVKKALVFYIGKPPQGVKTHWIMIEYRIPDTLIKPQRSKSSMRLDNWVLCRIRQKGNMSKNTTAKPPIDDVNTIKMSLPVYTNNPLDTCSNYFMSKDCIILAKLLGAEDYPQSVTVSSTTSQNSNTIDNPMSFQASLSMLCPNGTDFYNHTESHGNMLKLNLSEATMQIDAFNNLHASSLNA